MGEDQRSLPENYRYQGNISYKDGYNKGQKWQGPNRVRGFPGDSTGNESTCNAEDLGSIPGFGRSPGEGNGCPLHILAWRIPWTVQSMGSQRVGHDLVTFTFTEAIKKRWQEYIEELYKKGLNHPDNHDSVVITHLQQDILKCEVQWVLGSVTTNKASEVMEFQLHYFTS